MPDCEGFGVPRKCDPEKVILRREASILSGATAANKALRYYSDPKGQFMATLREVAKQKGWNLEQPWQDLAAEVKDVLLYGTGENIWDVTWEFQTKSRSGPQVLKVEWLGFCNYIDEEFQRKVRNKNVKNLEILSHDVKCTTCVGSRLKKKEVLKITFVGYNIYELMVLSISKCLEIVSNVELIYDLSIQAIVKVVLPPVRASL